MFNITGGEIFILLVLALVVVGPERLPDVIRKFGKTYGELKKMSTGFQTELRDALDEPLREMRETADQLRKTIEDPINETVKSGTDAVKGVGAIDAASTVTTKHEPGESGDSSSARSETAETSTEPSASSVDPVVAADTAVFADEVGAALPPPTAATTNGSLSSPSLLPPPSGHAQLPPPGADAVSVLAPPTLAAAADPASAPEAPIS